jgi:hypothetical protein
MTSPLSSVAILLGVVECGLVPVVSVRDQHLLCFECFGDVLAEIGLCDPEVPVLHALIVAVSVDKLRCRIDPLAEFGCESFEYPEDGFEVRLHVPEEVETVLLHFGECLLMGDDVAFGVFLCPEDTDESGPYLLRSVVVEGLLVQIE